MRISGPAISTAVASALVGCSPTPSEEAVENTGGAFGNEQVALAQFVDARDTTIGSGALESDGTALSINLDIESLEPGPHGFHLHSVGRCDGPEFATAGPHLNPFGKSHGKLSADGKHVGDLPNIIVREDGTAKASVPIDGDATELIPHIFDEDGTAVILHADSDDYTTDPSGAAGSRVACAVLVRHY